MIRFHFNDVELDREDFPNTLQGWVAFSIVFVSGVHCANKEAALELLFQEADSIIERIRQENDETK